MLSNIIRYWTTMKEKSFSAHVVAKVAVLSQNPAERSYWP
jgi:hypothetical protein